VVEFITAEYGTQKQIGISFVYYDYKKEELGDPSRIIKALIKQLCRTIDTIPADLCRYKSDSHQPPFGSLQSSFIELVRSFKEVFLLVDALDECPERERYRILRFLTEIVRKLPRTKVFVTSRKEPDIARAFEENETPVIRIKAENVAEDIETFVRAEIKRLRKGYDGKILHLESDALENKITKTLTDGSEGM
jgi:hypothetical protein